MIYIITSPYIAQAKGIDEYSACKSVDELDFIRKAYADTIFRFNNGATEYIKSRFSDDYQYTDEEQVVIKLRSVQL